MRELCVTMHRVPKNAEVLRQTGSDRSTGENGKEMLDIFPRMIIDPLQLVD